MSTRYSISEIMRGGLGDHFADVSVGDMVSLGRYGQSYEHFGIITVYNPKKCQFFCRRNGECSSCKFDGHWMHIVHLNGKDGGSSNTISSSGNKCGYVTRNLFCDLLITERYDFIRVYKNSTRSVAEIQGTADANVDRYIGFSGIDGNCEHFARFCYTGSWVSHQVKETAVKATLGASGAFVGGLALCAVCPPVGAAVAVGSWLTMAFTGFRC